MQSVAGGKLWLVETRENREPNEIKIGKIFIDKNLKEKRRKEK